MYKVLLADLDLNTTPQNELISYNVDLAYNIEDFYNMTYNNKYDLYLLNYYYYDAYRELKDTGDTTITLFTDEYYDINHLKNVFDIADDYIIKPINLQELKIRVEYQLKKLYNIKKKIITYKDLYFYTVSKQLYQKKLKVKLSPNEAKLVEYFLCQVGTPLSKVDILDYLESSSDGTLRVYISKLNKIGFSIRYERANLSYTLE